jgi:hypothetical protein
MSIKSRFGFRQHHGSPVSRLKIARNSKFTIFIHKIIPVELEGVYPHDHGCDFFSFGLRGGYTEELFDDPYDQTKSKIIYRGAGKGHIMRNSQAHKFVSLSRDNVYTLFITWNFVGRKAWLFTPEGPITFEEFAKQRGIINVNDLKNGMNDAD